MTRSLCLTLATGLILAIGYIVLIHKPENPSRDVSLIKIGMTQSDVQLHLETPDATQTITKTTTNWTGPPAVKPIVWEQLKKGDSATYWIYMYETGRIILIFDTKSSAVINSRFIKNSEITYG